MVTSTLNGQLLQLSEENGGRRHTATYEHAQLMHETDQFASVRIRDPKNIFCQSY